MTIKEIRNELKTIKYYYGRQCDLDIACKTVGENIITKLLEKYNTALKDADPKLLDIYVCLYVNGSLQEDLAEDMGVCCDTIKHRNKLLVEYFQKVFSE